VRFFCLLALDLALLHGNHYYPIAGGFYSVL